MLLLALILSTTVLASLPGLISSKTSVANEIPSGKSVPEALPTEHADLKLRDDCPVPCK